MKYALISLGNRGHDAGVFVGLCLPKQCGDQVISASIDSALTSLGIPLSVFSVDSDIEHYTSPMTWASYLTIFILLTAFLLTIIATIHRSSKKDGSKILGSFDVTANMKHFKVREKEDLNVWDGVRALAMMWVVVGHCFTSFLQAGVKNIADYLVPASRPFFLVVIGALFSVDVFLALGGFFLAFVMLRYRVTAGVCGMGVLQRVLRVWPAYIVAMLFFFSLLMRLGSGILWRKMWPITQMCQSMWKEVFFVSNFVYNGSRPCMGWGWYLQVDFQLFLCGLLLLYCYSRSKPAFYFATLLLALGSSIFVLIYTLDEEVRIYADVEAAATNS
jgi:hypothetical protein